jgi:hypothetical protein
MCGLQTFNQRVVGSIPTALTKHIKDLGLDRKKPPSGGLTWG